MDHLKELTYEITWKCDLDCIFCSTAATNFRNDFVGIDEFKRQISLNKEFAKIRLSGWEPFLNERIIEMLDFLRENSKTVEILSSWVVNKKPISQELLERVKWKVEKIIFSMHWYCDSYNDIVNPSIKYWTPYWDIMMDSVEECAEIWISFDFHCVILEQNLWELELVIKNVALLNSCYKERIKAWKIKPIWIHFLRYIKQWRWITNQVEPVNKEIIARLPDFFEEMRKKYNVNITFSSNIDMISCDCWSKKKVICADGSEINCSALKWKDDRSDWKFPCLNKA